MKPHQRIFFIQFAVALSLGAFVSRLPDLQLKFSLTEGELGLLLAVMSSGVLCGLTFSVRFIERLGARTTAFVTVFGASLFFALIPWMPSALLAVPLFFIAGVFTGAFEINANIETDRHEALLGYRIMSRAHGMWSLGFCITALVAAGMRQAAVSIELHTFIVLVTVLIAGSIVFAGIENAPRRQDAHSGDTPIIAFPTIGLLPLCLVAAAPLLAEGASVDWSAIYMRDVFAVEPFVGGLSVTIFSSFIAIGRLGMDPVIDRFNPRPVAITLLGIAAIGVVMVATATHPVVALAGFGLTGIGCSSVYPLAISAAARRTDRPAPVNVAALGQTTFLVFFAGPPLLGFVAEHFGIRFSYWAVVPVLAAALLVTRALAADPAPVTGQPEPAQPRG
ncbi:MFS transporter [Rhizobium leguminosarum]|uniref:Major facilitator transporter n=1 Tax=Rhizobium leguminosarum bv. trifolii TaxID=386 RepID=A0A1B8R6W3_RHILT|nr:MFS transporter [Rhizobium leguminosarum]MDH6658474.1 MFS family permease [Rhizobium sophorae]AOO92720.1 major facilitator transporter [Rhizobium leguminosarum bv. trifolii]MBB4520593.1 MFS family permease [Rhizobium leguminosarum]NKK03525.1 MFS transporter [Rhizobium leguminosarum bv. viciae]NKK92551.1 MFS transporter [Rhizobium leguminosarum bv. viciae]